MKNTPAVLVFAANMVAAKPALRAADAPAQPAAPAPAQPAAAANRIDWNAKAAPWGALRNAPANAQQKTPFKVFDNVYYVGLQTVASYLVPTGDGLVLFDATYANTADQVLANVRTLGFDPKQIKYILISHAHDDHFGGAGAIVQATGAKVVMSALDWAAVEQAQTRSPAANGPRLTRDVVAEDGGSLKVGDTTFKFYVKAGVRRHVLIIVADITEGVVDARASPTEEN